MKYNSIENAEVFITEQIALVKANGYKDFTIWSNGKQLRAKLDTSDIENKFQDFDFEREGYWKAIRFENGHRVEF